MNTYDNILNMVDVKYAEIYSSLFSFNDDLLDENLLHYLYRDNYIVLMRVKGEMQVMAGLNSSLYGYDPYGSVARGFAKYQYAVSDFSQFPFNEDNAVVIYSNREKISMREKIYEILTEMASVHFIMQNNLRLSNIKAIINASAKTASTMENILAETLLAPRSYIVNKDKDKLKADIDTIDLDVEYIADKYVATIQFYHQQILELFGINFTPYEKQERLVVGEVMANNELLGSLKSATERRFTRYLNKANALFGTSYAIEIQEEEELEEEVIEESTPTEEVEKDKEEVKE